ncbi:MAG: hypothetical protein IKA75_07215 [Bacteroidaceae bacterium]|nr:hypothetical protein [Bacteroidaceae bacterium]
MKTFKLLPHSWQTVGWIITGMGAGLMLFGASMDKSAELFLVSSLWVIGSALWTIGFLFLAFSQELYEDERIRSIRMNTLGIVAIIYGIMIILYPIMDFVCLQFTGGSLKLASITAIRGIFFKPLIIYVVLFKFFLWKENRSLQYEENA